MIKKISNFINKYSEILRYLITGISTTIVSLIFYWILTSTFLDANVALQLQIANVLAWIGAVTYAFFVNKYFVFKSKNKNILKECASFFGARTTTLLVDMVFMFLFVTIFKFNDKIIKLIDQVVIIILNYILSKLFVFKKEKKENC